MPKKLKIDAVIAALGLAVSVTVDSISIQKNEVFSFPYSLMTDKPEAISNNRQTSVQSLELLCVIDDGTELSYKSKIMKILLL